MPLALLPAALEALVVGDVIRLLADFLYIKYVKEMAVISRKKALNH